MSSSVKVSVRYSRRKLESQVRQHGPQKWFRSAETRLQNVIPGPCACQWDMVHAERRSRPSARRSTCHRGTPPYCLGARRTMLGDKRRRGAAAKVEVATRSPVSPCVQLRVTEGTARCSRTCFFLRARQKCLYTANPASCSDGVCEPSKTRTARVPPGLRARQPCGGVAAGQPAHRGT